MEKQRWGRVREEKSRSEKRKRKRKEDAGARKGSKVAKHCVFPMICGSGGSKSRLAKAAGAEPCGQMRDEKLHAVVARSTIASEKAKNTSRSDHFWKLRLRKSARRCGAKHISKSKCTKYTTFRPLLEVEMSIKKCMPLWHEAHFEVKSVQNWRVRSTFGRSVSLCVACQKWAKREGRVAFSTTTSTLHYIPLHYNYNYNYTTDYITLHYRLHYTTLHYISLQYATYTTYTTLHFTTTTTNCNYTLLHYNTLFTLQYTNYTTLRYTPLHYTTLQSITLHYNYNYGYNYNYIALDYITIH